KKGKAGDVRARMGHARNEPLGYWIIDHREDDRDRRGGPLNGRNVRSSVGQDDLRREPHKLCRIFAHAHDVAASPAPSDCQVAPLSPPPLRKSASEYRDSLLRQRVILADADEHADAAHLLPLLRARRKRPRRRAAEQCDEVASSQSWHRLSPPRAADFPHPQPSTERLPGPWANPESFCSGLRGGSQRSTK